MEEKIYFNDNVISVTSSRVILGATTYALRNVSSVKMLFDPPKRMIEIILIAIGIISLIIGIAMDKGGGVCIGLGIILGILGGILFSIKKTTYYVQLGTNAGESRAYSSVNQQHIQEVVNAINEAIIEYK